MDYRMVCRANPRDFSKISWPYGPRLACAWKLSIHVTFIQGLPMILGPHKVRRQSCRDLIGAFTSPVVCWRPVSPVRTSYWPRTAHTTDRTSIFIRHPHGPTWYLHRHLTELQRPKCRKNTVGKRMRILIIVCYVFYITFVMSTTEPKGEVGMP